jgi:hypothetical protein
MSPEDSDRIKFAAELCEHFRVAQMSYPDFYYAEIFGALADDESVGLQMASAVAPDGDADSLSLQHAPGRLHIFYGQDVKAGIARLKILSPDFLRLCFSVGTPPWDFQVARDATPHILGAMHIRCLSEHLRARGETYFPGPPEAFCGVPGATQENGYFEILLPGGGTIPMHKGNRKAVQKMYEAAVAKSLTVCVLRTPVFRAGHFLLDRLIANLQAEAATPAAGVGMPDASKEQWIAPGEQSEMLGLSEGDATRRLQLTAQVRNKAVKVGLLGRADLDKKGRPRGTYVLRGKWRVVSNVFGLIRAVRKTDERTTTAFKAIPGPSTAAGAASYMCRDPECGGWVRTAKPNPACPLCGRTDLIPITPAAAQKRTHTRAAAVK